MTHTDKRRLVKALREIDASVIQWKMAFILYNVNGIENALEFVRLLAQHGLVAHQPKLFD
ncbi:MAG: hypothetical protein JW741_06075 [Sedimentisphaerales bacterium]|nr:hypothetical protein [Sedimentisphaerales bacterium]